MLRLFLDEEPNATRFADATSQGNHGVCAGATCPSSGLYGRAGTVVEFDGIDDVIAVRDAPSLHFGAAGSFTAELWFLPKSTGCGFCTLLSKYEGNRGFHLDLADDGGHSRLTFFVSDGVHTAITRVEPNIMLNSWHHVVAIFDRAEERLRLFVDGVETAYQRQDDTSEIGDLSNAADLLVGNRGDGADGYRGLVGEVGIYRQTMTADEVANHFRVFTPPTTPWFVKWNSNQVLTVFAGFGQEVGTAQALVAADWGNIPALASDAVRFALLRACATCNVTVYSFSTPQDLEAVRQALALQAAHALDPESYSFSSENVLVHIDGPLAATVAQKYEEALRLGTLKSILEAPTNTTDADYESWDAYYPTDRGQQRDTVNRRSQRTFDRWEANQNRWLFGQSTWLYQDPDSAAAPPFALPPTYGNHKLDYYYHFHCEQNVNPNAGADCLNWQIYIEVLTNGADDTELANWARGGWGSLTPQPIRWEVYYDPSAFPGGCTPEAIVAGSGDATLQSPNVKRPLLFRLPAMPGAWSASPEVCAITFNSYLYRVADVRQANRWRTTTTLLNKVYDATIDRYTINAENRYYEFMNTAGDDVVYRQWAAERYWSTEKKATEPLQYGLQAFWWWTWPTPPEANQDRNVSVEWGARQWCRLDKTQGPAGLGQLVCGL